MTTVKKSTQDALRTETEKKLSKYGTPQLLSKLRAGSFFKMSKEVALAILEKRGEDISEFKDTNDEKGGVKEAIAKKNPESKVSKESKAPKVPKEPKVKKEKAAAKTFVAIDEKDPAVSKIIDSGVLNKTEKIKGLLELGYTPNQISKSSLGVRYAFCFTVKTKMSNSGSKEA